MVENKSSLDKGTLGFQPLYVFLVLCRQLHAADEWIFPRIEFSLPKPCPWHIAASGLTVEGLDLFSLSLWFKCVCFLGATKLNRTAKPEPRGTSANPKTMGAFLCLSHEQCCIMTIVPPSREERHSFSQTSYSPWPTLVITEIKNRKK